MKTLIYPFDFQAQTILKFSEMLIDIEIISCVTPKCFGMLDKELKCKDKIIKASENFEQEIEKCELVWFINSELPISFEDSLIPKIKNAIQKDKKILITKKLTQEEKKIVRVLIPKENYIDTKELDTNELNIKRLYNIKTPIITVCSLYNGLQSFSLELALRKELSKNNVNVLQIGSDSMSKIFGMEEIPEDMFNNEISESEKIVKFNHFLKAKELEKNYDVILLGIPGELLPLKEDVFSDLGIYAFEMLKTITSDCSILCIPCEENIVKNRQEIAQIIQNSFSLPVDFFNLAPLKIDIECSEEEKAISYVRTGKEILLNKINENTFCIEVSGEIERLTEQIIKQLRKYGDERI